MARNATTKDLTAAQHIAYMAMRNQRIDHDQCMRLVVDGPQDTKPVRSNQGWFDGVEAARRGRKHCDYSGYTLGHLGTKEYREAFAEAVRAYNG